MLSLTDVDIVNDAVADGKNYLASPINDFALDLVATDKPYQP